MSRSEPVSTSYPEPVSESDHEPVSESEPVSKLVSVFECSLELMGGGTVSYHKRQPLVTNV